jgi:serine/threonine protein kinase
MATLDDYQIIKDLGSGAFSTVKLAKHKATGELVALKVIKDDALKNQMTLESFKNEIEIMQEISHPYLVNLKGYTTEGNFKSETGEEKTNVIYLNLELAKGGELFDFIAQTGSFSEPVARYYFHQIIDAFEYLHGKGISHRDMKPDNIMLDDDFNLKIADFGFSTKAASNQSFKGTRGYMAPEILVGVEYHGTMVDIFAAGIILFIMITQIPPFQMAHPKDGLYKYACLNRMDQFWKFHFQQQEGGKSFFSKSFIDLINWIFNFDVHVRPSLAEIKTHEWYNGPTASKEEVFEEFQKRKEMLEGTSDGPVPEHNVSTDVYDERSVTRGVTGEVEDNNPTLKRQEAEYIPELGGFTKFFSTSNLKDLFACAAQFAMDKTSEYEFSASEFSVTMSDSDEDKNKVTMKVDIMKVDSDKHAIQATKISGDRFQFNKLFKELKGFFGGHINAKA